MPLIIGFVLTLLATAATLVAPVPDHAPDGRGADSFQNRAPIDHGRVVMYLSGLFASALLAWGLGWGRTYILAWVSERIGADLRTTYL